MILDRSSAVPLYFQIYQQLLEQIHAGVLQRGRQIPSEPELASSFGVSRMTARQAVRTLCDAGVTYSQRGLGTFVSGSKKVKTSTELLSFTQETKASGGRPSSRVLAFVEVQADGEVGRALHLGPKANVFRLKRVRIADSIPVSIEECFLPAKLCPNLLDTFDPRTSLYQVLADRYGIRMTAADEAAEAALAQAEEARFLQIKKGSPVFVLTRISYVESSQPVEYVRSTYRGDRWKLVSRLTANQKNGSSMVTQRSLPERSGNSVASRRTKKSAIGNDQRSKVLSNLARQQEES